MFSKWNITLDSSHVRISDLSFKNNKELIYIDGNVSKYPGDILYTEFKNFKLSNLAPLTPDGLELQGNLNGSATMAQLYETPLVFTRDSISDFKVNEIDFGNFYLTSHWDSEGNKIHANAYNLKGSRNQYMNDTLYGDYWPEKDSIDFTLEIKSLTVKTLEEYYSDFIIFNPTAFITGKINMNGNLKDPNLTGDISLKQAFANITYLNTVNKIDEMNIHFDNNIISFNDTRLTSGNINNTALLKGNIKHKNFSDFNLNIGLDVNNFMLMNLPYTDSSYFYGTAYGTGNLTVKGPLNDIQFNADIVTNKNTYITIPISSSETLEEENSYIKFTQDSTTTGEIPIQEEYSTDLSGFSMDIKLNVSPEATIEIIPDENTGEITSVGQGNININMNREGDLSMFGNYEIVKGKYDFNLASIRKNFKIEEGGSINWYGAPEDATIDIKAVYELSDISIRKLAPKNTEENRKTDVSCYIHMTGLLLDPAYKLYVEIPENIQDYSPVFKSMSDNDMNKQFISLLILKIFQPITGESQDTEGVGEEFLAEQLTDQINNFIKGLGSVDLGVTYDQGEVSDKVGLKVRQSVWDDRIEIIGEFGGNVSNTQSSKPSDNYVGEFEIEAKLNRKGNIRAKFYNEANDQLENEGQYTQGIGFIWRKKFNTFRPWARKEDEDRMRTKRFIKKLKQTEELPNK